MTCSGGRVRKVLVVAGQLTAGGAERELVTFLQAARDPEWDLSVVCLNAGGDFQPDVERLTGRPVRIPPARNRLGRLLWMRQTIKAEHPDLIHSWNLYPMFYLKWAFVRHSCPVVGFLQCVPGQAQSGPHGYLFKYLAAAPDGLVSNSRAALQELAALGVSVSLSAVVPNAVQDRFFTDPALPEALAMRKDRPVVAAVGRLIARKRVDWMIAAVARMARDGAPCDLWIVGEGPERSRLERLVEQTGLRENVRFWGLREDVPGILKCADVFLHCARTEGLPNALQEAMACGLPIVAPRTSGVPEVVADGHEGVLYGVDNQEECFAALRRLLDDGELRKRMGRAALARAAQNFRPEDMARAMLSFYESVLAVAETRRGNCNAV